MFVSRREKKVVLQGTVTPCQDFNGEVEANKLRSALKSKNLSVVCDVLGKTSNSQRQEIKTLYKQQFGRDLEEDVKKTLSGDFEILCRALLMTPAEYDAYCLHKAMLGLGTHESVLIEILVTRTNEELIEIRRIYRAKYGKDLESDIKADTSGDFKKLMVSLANAERPEDATVDLTKAIKDAEALVHAGVARWGRDEETFNRVMATQSFRQLRAVFNSYDKLITEDIRADIKREFDGDVGNGLVAIVDFVRDRNAFFATKLNNALTKGMTRNDIHIIRIVVSRSEIDLRNIKRTYFEQYGKIFVDIVANQMTGEYQRLLLAILG